MRRTQVKLARLISSLFLACLSSVSAYAVPNWHTSTLHAVYPMADGSFVLRFTTNAPTCSDSNTPCKYQYVNQNGMTEVGAQKICAAAFVALASGKTVSVNFDDASDGCYVNRLLMVE